MHQQKTYVIIILIWSINWSNASQAEMRWLLARDVLTVFLMERLLYLGAACLSGRPYMWY